MKKGKKLYEGKAKLFILVVKNNVIQHLKMMPLLLIIKNL